MPAAALVGVLVGAEPDRQLLAAGRHAGRVAHRRDSPRSGPERTFPLHGAAEGSLYRSPRDTLDNRKLRRAARHPYDGLPLATSYGAGGWRMVVSRWPFASGVTVSLPPGHRTHTDTGTFPCSSPSTWMAPSSDQ